MNRFYAAEAIKCLSSDTWREVMGSGGRQLLTTHIASALDYYTSMCLTSSNHMVVEAGCHALAEVIARVDRGAVLESDRLPLVVDTLTQCLKDERWPVRDAACSSTGLLVRWYPDQSLPVLDEYLRLWQINLRDCIWSVRENAAVAYSEAMQSGMGDEESPSGREVRIEVFASCVSYISNNLLAALKDHVNVDKKKDFSFLPLAMLAPYKQKAAIDSTVLPLDSSVSSPPLALSVAAVPPASKKKGWGCCVDCVELRPAAPWEVTHGALYLLRELSKSHPEEVIRGRLRRPDHTLVTLSDGATDGGTVSFLDAMWELLLATDLVNGEKLHSAIYEEVGEGSCVGEVV
jgi:hypothetical protein